MKSEVKIYKIKDLIRVNKEGEIYFDRFKRTGFNFRRSDI
jgi:hypothetical protein